MTSSVEQLRDLIPLYLNGSLNEIESSVFLEQIKNYPELERELSEFSDINDTFNAMPMPDGDHFDALFNKIEVKNSAKPIKKNIHQTNKDGLITMLRNWLLNPFISWGVALAQFAILAVVIFNLQPEESDVRYQSLSQAVQNQKASINLVFGEMTTVQQINRFMHKHQLEFVSGPGSTQVYQLSAPEHVDLDKLVAELRQAEIVRFAEKL